MTLEVSISLESYVDGAELDAVDTPPISFDMSTTVDQVDANGDASLTYTFANVSVGNDDSTTVAQEEAFAAAVSDEFDNLDAKETVSNRGVVVTAGTSASQAINAVTGRSTSITVPFPEEAVGEGARWRTLSSARAGGIRSRVEYTFTLREVNGQRVVVEIASLQTAPRQRVQSASLPELDSLELTDYRIQGKGEAVLDLARRLPETSEYRASGQGTFEASAGTAEEHVTQRLGIDYTLEAPAPVQPSA